MARLTEPLTRWWLGVTGGAERGRILLLLALVLGLDTADLGAVGSVAGQLEVALHLSNADLGLLAAIPSISAGVCTLPMGILADRTNRVRLLWLGMIGWCVAQALSATAGSFQTLMLIRIGLGITTAVAAPAVASLVGDLFPAVERGRVWGLIISGELIGAAFGYIVSGEMGSFGAGSWRLAFLTLSILSLVGAVALRRWLEEPVRGGEGQLQPRNRPGGEDEPAARTDDDAEAFTAGRVQEEVQAHEVDPEPALVLRSDPQRLGLPAATRYVLRIRTNVVLITASALGYFYFTGIETFGLVYFQGRFHIAHGAATLMLAPLAIGGLAGAIGGGRLADRGLDRGRVNSRITVAGWCTALASLLFVPGLLAGSVVLALPAMTLAATSFSGRNPPLDAARLDIMHHHLWGRAESIRTLLRRLMTASAPIVFGLLADALAPPGTGPHATSGAHGFGANANARGLEFASLLLLVTVVLGSICTFAATRTYPRDVATALASERATRVSASSR